MLKHSQKQDEAARLAQLINSGNPSPYLYNDFTYKLQQVQSQSQVSSI